MTKISVVFQIVTNAEITNVMDYWNLTKWPNQLMIIML
jgi:hypothetical protein